MSVVYYTVVYSHSTLYNMVMYHY